MIGIIEADRDELARARHRHAVAWCPFYQRQAGGIDRGERGKRIRRQRLRRDVGMAGERTQAAVGVDQAGLFLPGGTIAAEFHSESFVGTRMERSIFDTELTPVSVIATRISFSIRSSSSVTPACPHAAIA